MAIRTLVAKFVADVRDFINGTKKANDALTPFQKQLEQIKNISKGLNIIRGGAVFAGITAAAVSVTRQLNAVNESLLDIERGSKTAGDAVKDFFRTVPITGELGQAIGGLIFGGADRREIAANERNTALAETMTRDMETRIDQTRKLKDEERKLQEQGRQRIQEMINLGREQADERTRELFDIQAKNRQKIAEMIELGRRQRDEKAMEDYANSLASVEAIVGRFRDPMLELQNGIKEVDAAFNLGMIGIMDYERATKGLQKEMEALAEKQKVVSAFNPRGGRGSANFREVSLSRTAIGGLSSSSGGQQVMDPQLKETNQLLRQIESRFRTNGATYAP